MYYERVKALCDEADLTIMECEKRAGLANGTIGGWRSSEPKITSLQAVASVLGVSFMDLIPEQPKANIS